jgi:molybdopterin molybdotransferase
MIDLIQLFKNECDIIIVSGGVSAGNHDYIKEASEAAGYKQKFWKVNQKPGKPMFFAANKNKYLFGLPGNPVATMICLIHYVIPFIFQLELKSFKISTGIASPEDEIQNVEERSNFLFVKVYRNNSKNYFKQIKGMQSHMISKVIDADGYVIVQPNSKINKNQECEIIYFPW